MAHRRTRSTASRSRPAPCVIRLRRGQLSKRDGFTSFLAKGAPLVAHLPGPLHAYASFGRAVLHLKACCPSRISSVASCTRILNVNPAASCGVLDTRGGRALWSRRLADRGRAVIWSASGGDRS